jgi:hypothetical protein
MWPFQKRTNIVTSKQFAAVVMEFIGRYGRDVCAELQKEAEDTWSLEPDEITILGNELFVAHLWMVSKAIATDKEVLNSLHDGYFQSCYHSGATRQEGAQHANAAQSELSIRYENYYTAFEKDIKANGGLALGFEMSQFFFPKHKPVLNAMIHFIIQTHVNIFITSLLKMRQEYKIAC